MTAPRKWMIVGHLGHWEGGLIIGAHGTSAAATLVERRTTRFVTILALPLGKEHLRVCVMCWSITTDTIPDVMRGSLTWDHGCGDAPVMPRSAWLPT